MHYYTGAMSYGKMVEVKDKHGVPIKTSDGTSRMGIRDIQVISCTKNCIEYSMVTLVMR